MITEPLGNPRYETQAYIHSRNIDMRNEGLADRTLRGLAGVVLLTLALWSGLAIFAAPATFWIAVVAGGVLLLTAITGFCPAYRLMGLKTCSDC